LGAPVPIPLDLETIEVVFAGLPRSSTALETLHVGASHFVAQYILPPLVKEFCLLYPSIELAVLTGDDSEVTGLLLEDQVDLALLTSPHVPRGIKVVPLPIRGSDPLRDVFLAYIDPGNAAKAFIDLLVTLRPSSSAWNQIR
jgi:hypothetical protein